MADKISDYQTPANRNSPLLTYRIKMIFRISTGIVLFLSVIDFVGWALDINILRNIVPTWEVMRIITATCLILTALSLIIIKNLPRSLPGRIIPSVFALFILIISLFTIYVYVYRLMTGNQSPIPGLSNFHTVIEVNFRMALLTAINFFFLSIVIFLFSLYKKQASETAHGIIIPVILISYYVIVSYVLGHYSASTILDVNMAFNTAIAFIGICTAVLSMKPESWLLKVFTGNNLGGIIARKMLPALLIIPMIIGWLRINGERKGLIGSEEGVILVVVAYTICFLVLIWFTARSINILEIKRLASDEALKKSEMRLKYHLKNSPLAVVEWDKNYDIIQWSEEGERIFGWKREEVLGKNINSLNMIFEEDIPIVARTMERLNSGQELQVVSSNRNYTKLGEVRDCIWFNSVLLDENGYMSSVLSLVQDVTVSRMAEESLLESEKKLWSVLNATKESVYMFDRESRFMMANATGIKRLGAGSVNELLGHNFSEFMNQELASLRKAKVDEVFNSLKPLEFEDERNGMMFHHSFFPVFRDEEVLYVVTYSADITERIEAEKKVNERTRELEVLNSKLQKELSERILAQEKLKRSELELIELNATKDKFFNIVAHDLKNPFTSLLGSSELLYENINQLDKSKIKKLATILNDSAKGGYAILQNLLDWSRSQTGLLKFNPENLILKNLVDENIANLKLAALNKKILIYCYIDDKISIYGDKNMIDTVLRNLLTNAIKFTRKNGKVVLDVRVDSEKVTVSVTDTGIGISENNIEKLFRIDTKFSMPGTQNEQGTGLGLKLCREFVEKMHGEIWVESLEDKGSKFSFTLPVKGV